MTDSAVDDFSYEIIRSSRRRSVGIAVKPDGAVRVSVPAGFPESRIHALVEAKSGWIRKKRNRFLALQSERQAMRFADGEVLPYLGRSLELRLLPDSVTDRCESDGRVLQMHIASLPDEAGFRERCLEALQAWYQQAAEEHFRRRAAHYAGILGLTPKLVAIKSYRTRWGSCHRDGRIYFNWRLIMAPPFVIDYVVIHELCHLFHADHSSRFWARVARYCPDVQSARHWLKEHGHGLDL